MQLYEFQKKALEDIKDFNNCLIAYDQGLGKTFIGSEKLAAIDNPINIIVCQKSKVCDWLDHMTEHYPDYTVIDMTVDKGICQFMDTIYGGNDKVSKLVGVINYDKIWRRQQFLYLRSLPVQVTLLLDESSLLQNHKSKRTDFIMKLGADANIMLSGTVVNGAYEKLWSQSRLLGWVDQFGNPITLKSFMSRFCKIYKMKKETRWGVRFIDIVAGYKNVEELKSSLRKFGAIFKKTDEVIDLPKQNFIIQKVERPKEYDKFERDKVVVINGKELTADFLLNERLILRQLAGAYNKHKLKAFTDLLDSTNDRLIVFYCFDSELQALIDASKKAGRSISVVNGRNRDLAAYENDDSSVTLIQYKAGSMGLNLQKAQRIVYFSLPEGEAESYQQSLKRIHRIGQELPCFYYHLITEGSIDEDILDGLNIKSTRIDKLFD